MPALQDEEWQDPIPTGGLGTNPVGEEILQACCGRPGKQDCPHCMGDHGAEYTIPAGLRA